MLQHYTVGRKLISVMPGIHIARHRKRSIIADQHCRRNVSLHGQGTKIPRSRFVNHEFERRKTNREIGLVLCTLLMDVCTLNNLYVFSVFFAHFP